MLKKITSLFRKEAPQPTPVLKKALSISHRIKNFFDKKKVKNLEDILKLELRDIIIVNDTSLLKDIRTDRMYASLELVYPYIIFNERGITFDEAYISIENNEYKSYDFIEINFNNTIDELLKYHLNEENKYYYSYKINGEYNNISKNLNEPECMLKELYKIYKDAGINEKDNNYPKKQCQYIMVPTNTIKLNNEFEYYFKFNLRKIVNNITTPTNMYVKIVISDKNKHIIPNDILLSLCLIQKKLYNYINKEILLKSHTETDPKKNKETDKETDEETDRER